MKKKRENEITLKEKEVKDLQKAHFGKDGDLFKKRQDLVKPIQDKVYNAIKKLATTGNYAVIFDKSSEGAALLYANIKYDKSDDVLNIMGIKPAQKSASQPGSSSKGSESKGAGGAPALEDSHPTMSPTQGDKSAPANTSPPKDQARPK